MKILLAAGVQLNGKVLKDPRYRMSEHITPLYYAIKNRQDEAILLLPDTDSVTNPRYDSVLATVMRNDYEPSSRIVTATIEVMVQRSNRLRSLAIAHLSHCELDRLCISHKDEPSQILDVYAAPTANALKNVGIKVPEALEFGRYGETVYHDRWHLSPELADRLWSSGFHDTNVSDEHGFHPLHRACRRFKLGMVDWLMSHGGDPTTVVRGRSHNASHILSQGFRNLMDLTEDPKLDTLLAKRGSYRDVPTRIVGLWGASCRDNCRCACSPQGCTPTSVLSRRASRTWYKKKDLFLTWCRLVGLSPDAIESCCFEFARVETFERLGITHVCCAIGWVCVSDPMPQDTVEEIQDEESEMIDQLESWMILYEEERAKFEGSGVQFLSKWSDMLKDELGVPASFEECWSRQFETGHRGCMPDYFTQPSRVEHG